MAAPGHRPRRFRNAPSDVENCLRLLPARHLRCRDVTENPSAINRSDALRRKDFPAIYCAPPAPGKAACCHKPVHGPGTALYGGSRSDLRQCSTGNPHHNLREWMVRIQTEGARGRYGIGIGHGRGARQQLRGRGENRVPARPACAIWILRQRRHDATIFRAPSRNSVDGIFRALQPRRRLRLSKFERLSLESAAQADGRRLRQRPGACACVVIDAGRPIPDDVGKTRAADEFVRFDRRSN